MLQKIRCRLRCSLMTWLSSGHFWAVLLGGLALSVVSKAFINLAIEPLSFDVSVGTLKGQIFPFPPGRLAITHSQHWAEAGLGNLLVIGWGVMMIFLFLSLTRRVLHHRIAYIGTGLFLAGAISNRGEVALFGHATDFLFILPLGSSGLGAIVNFADLMIAAGLVLLLIWSPVYRLLERTRCQRMEAPEPGT